MDLRSLAFLSHIWGKRFLNTATFPPYTLAMAVWAKVPLVLSIDRCHHTDLTSQHKFPPVNPHVVWITISTSNCDSILELQSITY